MIDACSDDGQAERHIHRIVKRQRFERNQTLVVIHADIDIGRRAHGGGERCVRGDRPVDDHSVVPSLLDRGFDQLRFLAVTE